MISSPIVVYDTRVFSMALQAVSAQTGVYRYTSELLAALAERNDLRLYLLICPYQPLDELLLVDEYFSNNSIFCSLKCIGAKFTLSLAVISKYVPCLNTKLTRWLCRLLDKHILAVWAFYFYRPVLHLPYFAIPQAIFRSQWKIVATIHDLIPLIHPEWFDGVILGYLTNWLKSILSDQEIHILVSSESTSEDVCDFMPDFDSSRLHRVPLAASSYFRPLDLQQVLSFRDLRQIPRDAKVILTTCADNLSKNFSAIAAAFFELRNSSSHENLRLVVAGINRSDQNSLYSIIQREGIESDVSILGHLSDYEMALAYNAADCFLSLSLYEGFGLSILEALSCGCPTVCSNTSSIPEVVADAAFLVEPNDFRAAANALNSLLFDPNLAFQYSQRSLKRSALFSWEKTAVESIRVYRHA